MRRTHLLAPALLFALGGCGGARRSAQRPVPVTPGDAALADAKSGADGKRSGASPLKVNRPHTDEVSFAGQDRTDWYQVELRGRPGVLVTRITWDSEATDVRIDVYDDFGRQIGASSVRDRGSRQKQLLTQIDRPGIYFIRVTAPSPSDSTVYTVEADWEEPKEAVAEKVEPPRPEKVEPPPMAPVPELANRPPGHEHPHEHPAPAHQGVVVQALVVSAYREGNVMMLYLDKGSAAGLKVGDTGAVLRAGSEVEAVEGGRVRVIRVVDANKSMATTGLRSVGNNNRVLFGAGH